MKTSNQYNEKSKEDLIKLLISQDEQIQYHKKQILFLEEYIKAQKLRQFANKS